MARKATPKSRVAATKQKGRTSQSSAGQTIKGQYEQDPKRRLGDFGQTGEAHRKT